ncbi:MAG TPA: hypothetical protein VF744_00655 [Beijerinckiaceae bacterium]|jgi:hypothetical protein
MAFDLDLRFDLKRLSDEELVARLEAAFAEREAIRPSPLTIWYNDRHRGLISHPAVYRLNCFLSQCSTFETILFLLVPFLLVRRIRRWLLDDPEARIYLLNCEILDLNDEVARRVKARRGVAA